MAVFYTPKNNQQEKAIENLGSR